MKRITAKNVLQIPQRLITWSDRVLWGKPLGRLVILAVLLSSGGAATIVDAARKAEVINQFLDAITTDEAPAAITADPQP